MFGIVMLYVPFLQLGALHGLNRELPYYVGKGDRRRVEELAAAAQAWALLLSAGAAAILLSAAGWFLLRGDFRSAAGCATCAVLSYTLLYNTYYLQFTFRTGHDFSRLALVNVIQSTLTVGLLVLVYLWSFYGLCLRVLIGDLVATALLFYWRPVRVGPKFNFDCLKHLLIIGFPIFVVGMLYTYWMTALDRQFILKFFGSTQLGVYNPAMQASLAFEFLPLAIIQVIYPRMAERYGHSGRLRELVHLAVKPTIAIVLVMIPLAVIGWWLGPAVLRFLADHYMPRVRAYLPGIPAMQWALLPPILLGFSPVNSVFIVAKRQVLYAVAILLGMGSYLGAMFRLIQCHGGLASFPQAMLVGRLVFIVVCYLMIYYLVRQDDARAVREAAGTTPC